MRRWGRCYCCFDRWGSSVSGCWGCCGYCLFLMLFFGFVEITFPVDICCLPTRRRDRKNCLEKCPHESYKMCLPGSSASSGGRPSGRWKRWSRSSGLFSFYIFCIHVSYFLGFCKQLKPIRGNESFILMSTFSGSSSRTRPQDKSRAWVLSLPYRALKLSTSISQVLPLPSLPEELVNGWMGLLVRLAHSLRLSLGLPCSAPPLGSLLQTLLG